jgi:hypothetical protein
MSQTGTGKGGARPHAFDQAMGKMGADRFLAATNPAEMCIGSQSDDTAAMRTDIAFKIQAGGKTLKVSGGEAVSMDLVMIAPQTDFGPLPQIVFSLLKNILEKNGNKTYHEDHVCLGVKPQVVTGRRVGQNSPPALFSETKKGPLRRPK